MTDPFLSLATLKPLLDRHNVHLKKSLGQNFMVDRGQLERIVAAATLTNDDVVLEVGPGAGSLTRHLAAAANDVVAVELDDRLLPVLDEMLADYANTTVVHGDILNQDIAQLLPACDTYKCVANIPYYVTAPIIRHLLESNPRPSVLVLTMQYEVGQRIVAKPGNMSLLAAAVQFYGEPTLVGKIAPGAFWPPPKVSSAILRIDVPAEPLHQVTNVDWFFKVLKAGFGKKRKQLINGLNQGLALPKPQIAACMAAANIDVKRRPETLAVAEWVVLSEQLAQL